MNSRTTTFASIPAPPPLPPVNTLAPTVHRQTTGQYYGSSVIATPVQASTSLSRTLRSESGVSNDAQTAPQAEVVLSQPVEESSSQDQNVDYRQLIRHQQRHFSVQTMSLPSPFETARATVSNRVKSSTNLSAPRPPSDNNEVSPVCLPKKPKTSLPPKQQEEIQPEHRDKECLLSILPELRTQFCEFFNIEQYGRQLREQNIVTREEEQRLSDFPNTADQNHYLLILIFKKIATGNYTPYSRLITLLKDSGHVLPTLIDEQQHEYNRLHPYRVQVLLPPPAPPPPSIRGQEIAGASAAPPLNEASVQDIAAPEDAAYMRELTLVDLQYPSLVIALGRHWKRLALLLNIPQDMCREASDQDNEYTICKKLLKVAFQKKAQGLKSWHSFLTEVAPFLGGNENLESIKSCIERIISRQAAPGSLPPLSIPHDVLWQIQNLNLDLDLDWEELSDDGLYNTYGYFPDSDNNSSDADNEESPTADHSYEATPTHNLTNEKCSVCYEKYWTGKLAPYLLTTCRHVFCKKCILKITKRKTVAKCPICSKNFTSKQTVAIQ